MTKAYEVFEKQYLARTRRSKQMYEEAKKSLAGGVGADGAYRRPYPLYMKEARGSRLWDIDGNEYIDLMGGAGPAILGHSPAPIIEAVKQQLDHGTQTLVTDQAAIELSRKICQHMPGMEEVRFVNSGSEAVHMAMRISRIYTGKEKHARFEGCYHGQLDTELISGNVFGGTEERPEAVAGSPGIPQCSLDNTVVLPWNNVGASVELIKEHAKELASVIIEPVACAHMGGIPADKNLVRALRQVCDEEGIVLIFDEVITAFRLALSGAYSLFAITPDLRTMAKLVFGGFPGGLYGGKREIMELVADKPQVEKAGTPMWQKRKMFQSGTFSANPVSAVAGLATIKELEKPGFYERINRYGERIRGGIKELADRMGIPVQIVGVGSMFTVYFGEHPVRNIRDIAKTDREAGGAFYMGLVVNGIYVAPFHWGIANGAMTDADVDRILVASEKVLKEMKMHKA
jgi:glutamate-1-semialdehyde 2,1-aminomutase